MSTYLLWWMLSALTSSPGEAACRGKEQMLQMLAAEYSNFVVGRDRITAGASPKQEFCLTRVSESDSRTLRSEAVWHEDVADPGDASLVSIRLTREADHYLFSLWGPDEREDTAATIVLRRAVAK